jgi:hypothetical protein
MLSVTPVSNEPRAPAIRCEAAQRAVGSPDTAAPDHHGMTRRGVRSPSLCRPRATKESEIQPGSVLSYAFRIRPATIAGRMPAAKSYFGLVSSAFFVPSIFRSLFAPLPANALISTVRARLDAALGRVMISWPFS